MVGYNKKYPITLQNKKGMWYNIRPCSFNHMNAVDKTPIMFIKKIVEAIDKTPNKINNKKQIIDNIYSQFYKLQFDDTIDSINNLKLE